LPLFYDLSASPRSIHLQALYESPHFRPSDPSKPARTLITGRPAPAYPSSLDTLLAALFGRPNLLQTFSNLASLDITTVSPPSIVTAAVPTLGLPVRSLDLTGADLSHFPAWFFDALGDTLERVVVRPPPARHVGPVDLLGRRRQRETTETGVAGNALVQALRRCRQAMRQVDLSGLQDSYIGLSVEQAAVLPRLTTFHLTSTTVFDPTAFLTQHADCLRHLTISLPLPEDVPSLSALRSLAIQGTKSHPGLSIADAADFFRSAQAWGSSVTDLDLCFAQCNPLVISSIHKAFPHVERLVLRGSEGTSPSPYGIEMVGSLVSHPSYPFVLSAFRPLTSPSAFFASIGGLPLSSLTPPEPPLSFTPRHVSGLAASAVRPDTRADDPNLRRRDPEAG
jgi:hypothetical protein